MLRAIDRIACANRWRAHSSAVAVLCSGLMLDALLVPPWPGALLVVVAATLFAVVGAGVPIHAFGRAMLIPLGFLALGTLGLSWSLDLSQGWQLNYSPSAAANALRMASRAWAAAAVTQLFAFTVPVPQWIALLRRLHTPTALLELIHLTYRSLFLLDEACSALVGAQRNRLGYRNASTALRSSGQAVAAILVRALRQSTRLERGLYVRGYWGSLVVLLPPSSTRALHLVLAVTGAALMGAMAWLSAFPWSR